MPRIKLFYLSDTVLEIGNGGTVLQKQISGTAITDASGETVDAEIWSTGSTPAIIGSPLSLTHQGSPDGYWSVNIPDDFASSALTNGLHVLLKVTVNAGDGFQLYMEMDGEVEVAKGDTVA